MIYAVIIACEVGFWLVLGAGLFARYVLRRPRLGAALLLAVPLVDLVLLAASVLDLRDGGTASAAHALAAVYLGVSVAFGHGMVRWADVRFAHRFAGGPAPVAPPRSGAAHARRLRRAWSRHVLAWAVGGALLLLGVLLVGDAQRTSAFVETAGLWTVVLLVDGVWSLSYSAWPRRVEARG